MRFRSPKPDFGLTGSMAQSEVFGEVKDAVEFKKWIENHTRLDFEEAIKDAKSRQPRDSDPHEPSPQFACNLHSKVMELLSLSDWERLSFFTAVGSHLDFQHGVDAFFELETDEGKKITVTLDVKTYESSDHNKANVYFEYPQEGLDPQADPQKWSEKIDEVATLVVDVLHLEMLTQRKEVAHATR
ncbi:MAG: hypothetical protein AAB358_02250 [Patescibacteria group bacterium]